VLHADERHLEFTEQRARGILVPKKIHHRPDADPKEGLKNTGSRALRTLGGRQKLAVGHLPDPDEFVELLA
jgi:hypothetical protein